VKPLIATLLKTVRSGIVLPLSEELIVTVPEAPNASTDVRSANLTARDATLVGGHAGDTCAGVHRTAARL
jgi:hypothetical protein